MTEKTKNKYAVPLTPYAPGGDLGVSMNAKKTADDFLTEASRKCFSEKDIVIDSIARPYILEAMEVFHQSKMVEDEERITQLEMSLLISRQAMMNALATFGTMVQTNKYDEIAIENLKEAVQTINIDMKKGIISKAK